MGIILGHLWFWFDKFPFMDWFFPPGPEDTLFLFVGVMFWRSAGPGGLNNSALLTVCEESLLLGINLSSINSDCFFLL